MMNKKEKLVYSTKTGDERRKSKVPTRSHSSHSPAQQNLKIMRDKKGRGGKMVTVISGFVLSAAELETLAKALKTFCGAGGTVKNEAGIQSIEVQGDHREKIAERLKTLGYKVKLRVLIEISH
jgi:translation initiation factor 1